MLKKYSIISLLLVAYTIVLGHSIIPHDHHNEDHATEQSAHHHDEHEDDHDNGDSGLAHDFANYLHLGNSGDLHQLPNSKIFNSTIAIAYIITSFDFKLNAFESPPPIVWHSNDRIPFMQCLSSKGLRAPPCSLA